MEERILSILEEICEDEVVYEDKDINLKEEGLMDSLAFVELLVRLKNLDLKLLLLKWLMRRLIHQIRLLSMWKKEY